MPPRRKRFQRTPEQLRALRQARKLAADIAKKSREGQQFGPVTEAGRAYQRATRKGEQVHGTRAARRYRLLHQVSGLVPGRCPDGEPDVPARAK